MLSELPSCTEDWAALGSTNSMQNTSRIPWGVCFNSVAPCGFVIDCHARQQWELQGRPFHTSGPRVFGMQVEEDEVSFTCVHSCTCSNWKIRKGNLLWPVGQRDSASIGSPLEAIGMARWQKVFRPKLPREAMEFRDEMKLRTPFFQVADHKCSIKNRGTWRHSGNQVWYELDYFKSINLNQKKSLKWTQCYFAHVVGLWPRTEETR